MHLFRIYLALPSVCLRLRYDTRPFSLDTCRPHQGRHVVNLVSEEMMHAAIQQLTTETRQADPLPPPVLDKRRGYLQQLDEHGLADLRRRHAFFTAIVTGGVLRALELQNPIPDRE
ncbi:hypothetical protein V1279_006494 [Bradyrhizobium sp. AZCC 1610]|uniref:hypothetical protein n=1 Tax=Bradyrhizobium sp. AZCC 1610 TaxID=3117020 RepID=UPI002FF1EBBA